MQIINHYIQLEHYVEHDLQLDHIWQLKPLLDVSYNVIFHDVM